MSTASPDSSDRRVAPVLHHLAAVAARVHTVWARMGVSAVDCQHRWDTFLHTALLPFIDDFGTLQAAAESNAATENDTLLREVCYLATRLDETPRHADVSTIVELLRRHYARTPMQSPLLGVKAQKNENCGAEEDGGEEEGLYDCDDCTDATAAPARRSTKELMFLSLPSFAELLQGETDIAPPLPATTEMATVKVKQEATSRPSAGSEAHVQWVGSDDDANNEEVAEDDVDADAEAGVLPSSMPSASASAATAKAALLHLMQGNTHEGVRRHLQAELDRLKSLADSRLRVLQLLCKQRALLTRSTAEQAALRAAYRAKYLSEEEVGAVEKLQGAVAAPTAAAAAAAGGAFEPAVSPPNSARFFSFPPSPKSSSGDSSSSNNGLHTATANTTSTAAVLVSVNAENMQSANSFLQQHASTRGTATQAELQLLLSTTSCSLDPPTSWDITTAAAAQSSATAATTIARSGDDGGASLGNESGATWPTCSSTTASSHRRTTATAAPTPTALTPASRPTVWDVDVSAITDYGTHQDLSLARIQREADAILAAIHEQNHQLQAETQAELQAFETLEVLWRAMSAQRTSPRVSPLEPTKESQAAQSERRSDAEKPSAVAAVDSLLSPLTPVPFATTKAQVIAHYARLCEAFAADVAAQRGSTTAASRAAAGATAAPSVGGGEGSQPSSLSSSARATGASAASTRLTDAARTRATMGNLYLPPVVRQVLRAASFAPVFDYVHSTRLAFQKHLSTQQDALVEKVMARLRAVYRVYHNATRDGAYAVAPDGELRVAMEEELLETLQSGNSAPAATATSGKVLLSFQRHLTACQQVREQAMDEIEYLRLRLHIIEQAEPLVEDYQCILREEAEMQATSRERLLSKKVNMAKQLLQEEKVRRRVAKDVPRIVAHLTELLAAWDALQAGAEPRQDTSDSASAGCTELFIRGQRVRDLLKRGGATTASATSASSRTRPRSASARPPAPQQQQQQQQQAKGSASRSLSPAVPASSRPRTEVSSSRYIRTESAQSQRHVNQSSLRRATPSPQPSPRPGPEGRAAAPRSGRHGQSSRSPSFASSTAAAAARRVGAPSPVPPPTASHSQPTTVASGASRVRSASPALRQALSARSANAPPLSKKSITPSPVPQRENVVPHATPLTTSLSPQPQV